MKKFVVVLYATIIFLFSCKRNNEEKEIMISINQPSTNYDTLIYRVTIIGDSNAYDELFYGFIDSNQIERTDSVMRYAKVMAEKFHYERAYFDYLQAFFKKSNIEANLSEFSKLDLTKLDESSKKSVLDWLNLMLKDKVITQEEFDSVKDQ
jgi:hypothetical protein